MFTIVDDGFYVKIFKTKKALINWLSNWNLYTLDDDIWTPFDEKTLKLKKHDSLKLYNNEQNLFSYKIQKH